MQGLVRVKHIVHREVQQRKKDLKKMLSKHQLPDVFVYLVCEGNNVCYRRFKPEDLIIQQMMHPPMLRRAP